MPNTTETISYIDINGVQHPIDAVTVGGRLYSLIPKADRFTSYKFSVYFNGILFTNDAKPQWRPGTYTDTAYSYLRMSSSSSNPYYNYYFYAFVDDLDNITNDPAPFARFPGSFGEVGDVITVRIEKN